MGSFLLRYFNTSFVYENREGKRDYLNRIEFPLSFDLSDFRKIDEVMPFPIFFFFNRP